MEKRIRVLVVEPLKAPYAKEIDNTLDSMQKIVDGYIECVYPWETNHALVCNEEGKLTGLPLNRPLYDEDENIIDIIAGTFFIAGTDDEEGEFTSLTDEDIEWFSGEFKEPLIDFSRFSKQNR